MANTALTKVGYGQVEPNRLTAQKTREVYSQLPAADSITTIENGMFLAYDEVKGQVTLPSADGASADLVMNEIILSDENYQADSDFVMKAHAATANQAAMAAYPRVYAMHVGDTFTSNVVKTAIKDTAPAAGDKFIVEATSGYLIPIGTVTEANAAMIFEAVKPVAGKTDKLPDGQMAVKFVCVKA